MKKMVLVFVTACIATTCLYAQEITRIGRATLGYSQGGAVAMATHRFIEEQGLSDEFHLAGSLCGDGPYSPLVTVLYYFEQDRKDVAMSMPIVFPLMLKGLCDYDEAMTNHKVGDYLNEPAPSSYSIVPTTMWCHTITTYAQQTYSVSKRHSILQP